MSSKVVNLPCVVSSSETERSGQVAMKLVQYVLRNEPARRLLGVRVGQEIVNVQAIKSGVPNTLLDALKTHKAFLDELEG